MFKNYFKIAYRNIIKQKAYSFINIFGLAIGLTACILVGLFIWQELHYDDFHENGDNIFRVSLRMIEPHNAYHIAQTPAQVAPTIADNLPEIEKISRIYFASNELINYGQKQFYEDNIIFADPDFFDMFTYQVLQGDESRFLKEKNTIVLSRETTEKYFGRDNPVGKTLNLNNKINFEVIGVIENPPVNSHFKFDMVTTYETIEDLPAGNYLEQWGATFGSYTYVMLNPATDIRAFESKVAGILTDKMISAEGEKLESVMQPLQSIHLHSQLGGEIQPNSSVRYVLILGAISLFILILACINFINLTTSRSVKRAREIGVRKVFGAVKHQLVRQFLIESLLITLSALLCALVIIEFIKPLFFQLIGTELIYNSYNNPFILLAIIGSVCLLGILAGLYPAFVLSQYKPAQVIKGSNAIMHGQKGSAFLRKGLVIFQFSISILLIIFTIAINQQVRFMRNFDMGFKKDQIIVLKTPERMREKSEVIKNELNAIPGVIGTSACLGAPILNNEFRTNLIPDNQHEENSISISVKTIDYDYFDLYGIQLIAGKRLSDLEGVDFRSITVINEATAKKIGFADPVDAIGHSYAIGLSDGSKRFEPEIIGVVKDFHFYSLHEDVTPLLFMYWPKLFKEVSVQVSPINNHETIKEIERVWYNFYPQYPFNYTFIDDQMGQLYEAEERSFRVITTFSFLAIFIACLGFLGLTFYTTNQRKKEIGIRKVLGASVGNIINNISFEFLKLVIIANVIAWPVGYFAVNRWLDNFPYKTTIHISLFVIAGLIAFFISALTIFYVVYRSAMNNPVKSLRYE